MPVLAPAVTSATRVAGRASACQQEQALHWRLGRCSTHTPPRHGVVLEILVAGAMEEGPTPQITITSIRGGVNGGPPADTAFVVCQRKRQCVTSSKSSYGGVFCITGWVNQPSQLICHTLSHTRSYFI